MTRWIETLLALQEVDMQIRNLNIRKKMIPQEEARLTKELDEAQSELREAKIAAHQTEVAIKENEAQIVKLYDAIAQKQQRSTMIRKNDEYQAALTEIANNKAKIEELESDIILLMDKQDAQKLRLKEIAAETDAQTVNIRNEIKELQGLVKEIDEMLGELEQERSKCATQVESELLRRYEALLRGKAGAPLVKIVNENCTNCHLRITPQTLTLAKRGAMASCDNCSHLVYLEA